MATRTLDELLQEEETTYEKPGISIELLVLLVAVLYGVVAGAGIVGLAWWLTG